MLLQRYKITVITTENSRLPGFLGSFLRGVFGETLKNYHPMGYQYFFRLQLNREHPYFKFFGNNPPAPYWFYIPRRVREIPAGETFHFFLTFIDNPFFPPESIPVLFRHAFERPLYKNQFKGKLFDVETAGFKPESPDLNIKKLKNLHTSGTDFTVHLPVPVSIKRDKKLLPPVNPLDLFHFIIHRGIMLKHLSGLFSSIEHITGKKEPQQIIENSDNITKPELLKSENLKKIIPAQPRLRLITIYRSPKRKEKYPMQGWTGQFTLKNVSSDFYKLLKLAEIIHVGSNTSVGFGKLRIEPASLHP